MSDELLELLTKSDGKISFYPVNPIRIDMIRLMGKWCVDFWDGSFNRHPVFEGESFEEALAAVKLKLEAEQ